MTGKEWYQAQLRKPEWKKKRSEIYKRDRFKCTECDRAGVTLNCHHLHYVSCMKPWEYPAYALVTLCRECHERYGKVMKFATHEDAEMWYLFAELEAAAMKEALDERRDRIDALVARGGAWDVDSCIYSVTDEDGRAHAYDADGNPL